MNNELKSRIYRLVDSIEDENVLQMIMDEISYYAGHQEIIDELNEEKQKELNKAISDADSDDEIDWEEFNKETNDSKKR